MRAGGSCSNPDEPRWKSERSLGEGCGSSAISLKVREGEVSGRPKVWAGAEGKLELLSSGIGRLERRPSGEPGGPHGGSSLSLVEDSDRWLCWDPGSVQEEDLPGAG